LGQILLPNIYVYMYIYYFIALKIVSIYAIVLMPFKSHHYPDSIHHIFWLKLVPVSYHSSASIEYYIIIELVALGNKNNSHGNIKRHIHLVGIQLN
jgi:hypothetical protein